MTELRSLDGPDALPPHGEMLQAFFAADPSYDGVFFTAVRTTGIFCRPSCRARKPKPENVLFLRTTRAALLAGYRPCKRCRPLDPDGATPGWLTPLLEAIEADPARPFRDADLRARGLSPERVRRFFQRYHGMTFHAYHRARRLGAALGAMRGGASVTAAAFDSGFDSGSGFGEAFRRLFGDAPSQVRETGHVVAITRLSSPLGPMLAGADDAGVCLLEFVDRRMLARQLATLRRRLGATFVPGGHRHIEALATALEAYFADSEQPSRGLVPGPSALSLSLPGTAFQRAVWRALRQIPPGETRSYTDVARAVGRPDAVRAVARAIGENRIAIFVPCHRVVGADGALTGYGGGLWRKRRLLEHERALTPAKEP